MSNTIALIPARSGSKGIPNKNIKMLGRYPLVAWSIMAASKSKFIDRVIVSTDSEDYASLAKKHGAEVPFIRPKNISGDVATDYDFILHALDWLKINDKEPEYIVHIRPTTPFRDSTLIDSAISLFHEDKRATSLRSAHKMSESAYKTFEISSDGRFKILGEQNTSLDSANIGRQQLPSTYQPNGYVDVLSRTFIRNNNLIHGDWVIPFITPLVLEVDTEDDFEHLEYQLVQSPQIQSKLFG